MRSLVIMAAVARFQSLQTPTNGLVVCLAVVDFLVGKLMMPLSLVRSIDSGHFGCCFCLANFLLDVAFFLMVLYRYIAVCDPLHYPARMSAVVWHIAVALLDPASDPVRQIRFLQLSSNDSNVEKGTSRNEVQSFHPLHVFLPRAELVLQADRFLTNPAQSRDTTLKGTCIRL
ncbi:hypothetical protein F7725_009988 [Dissostichus mawsoni]|uniref:Uncharacterized protein n=1 Tax=Dissostichus mawsoni TaxID=36200 RepID=A0A7J5XMJ5_DISMA|nr:hypothetical protein F7725_009988 [Dissostichus mawsoni]